MSRKNFMESILMLIILLEKLFSIFWKKLMQGVAIIKELVNQNFSLHTYEKTKVQGIQ